MTPARPDVKAIFSEALRLPEGAGRAAYLDRACGGDACLRLRVETLLAAHARADDVLGPAGATSVANPATTGHDPGAAETIGPNNPGPTMGRPKADAPPAPAAPGGDRDADTLARGNRVRYFGDYEIRRELGRGGMGVVYEARQVSLNPTCRPQDGRSRPARRRRRSYARFKNEAEAVALLDHPGIVPVYEVGAYDSQHYFSMKLVPGGSLVPLMTRYRDDPKAAARLAAEAAEAVSPRPCPRHPPYRDLKPANILLDDLGRPHLTDFGLAKKVEDDVELTQLRHAHPRHARVYVSPEQASGRRGARHCTASDVYGLGRKVLLLHADRPRCSFGGDSVVETIDAVRHRLPEPPRQLNAALPRDLETICLRCLEKDPRRRYPTALALAEDLRAWLDNAGRSAGAAGRTGRAGRGCGAGRRPMWSRRAVRGGGALGGRRRGSERRSPCSTPPTGGSTPRISSSTGPTSSCGSVPSVRRIRPTRHSWPRRTSGCRPASDLARAVSDPLAEAGASRRRRRCEGGPVASAAGTTSCWARRDGSTTGWASCCGASPMPARRRCWPSRTPSWAS